MINGNIEGKLVENSEEQQLLNYFRKQDTAEITNKESFISNRAVYKTFSDNCIVLMEIDSDNEEDILFF